MFYESNNNWQTGENNSFEVIVNGALGLVLIMGIILIFYTPKAADNTENSNIKNTQHIEQRDNSSNDVQQHKEELSETIIEEANKNIPDAALQQQNDYNIQRQQEWEQERALRKIEKKERKAEKQALKAQKKAEKEKAKEAKKLEKEEKRKKSKIKTNNIEDIEDF